MKKMLKNKHECMNEVAKYYNQNKKMNWKIIGLKMWENHKINKKFNKNKIIWIL